MDDIIYTRQMAYNDKGSMKYRYKSQKYIRWLIKNSVRDHVTQYINFNVTSMAPWDWQHGIQVWRTEAYYKAEFEFRIYALPETTTIWSALSRSFKYHKFLCAGQYHQFNAAAQMIGNNVPWQDFRLMPMYFPHDIDLRMKS